MYINTNRKTLHEPDNTSDEGKDKTKTKEKYNKNELDISIKY